jgi:hypothetical protein
VPEPAGGGRLQLLRGKQLSGDYHCCKHTTCHVRDYVGVCRDASWGRDGPGAVAHPVGTADAEENAHGLTCLDHRIGWTADSVRRHRSQMRWWSVYANHVTPNPSTPDPSGDKFGNRHPDREIAKATDSFAGDKVGDAYLQHVRLPVLPSNLGIFLRDSGNAASLLKDRPRDTEPCHLGEQRGSFQSQFRRCAARSTDDPAGLLKCFQNQSAM